MCALLFLFIYGENRVAKFPLFICSLQEKELSLSNLKYIFPNGGNQLPFSLHSSSFIPGSSKEILAVPGSVKGTDFFTESHFLDLFMALRSI